MDEPYTLPIPVEVLEQAIDAMRTTARLFNLPQGHCLVQACDRLNVAYNEADDERDELKQRIEQ